MDIRKAISPILATVILIAVTLVVAIGFIGWVMGIWGSLGTPSESLSVTGGGTAVVKKTGTATYLRFNLTLTNKGGSAVNLSKIEVPGIGSVSSGGAYAGCNYSSGTNWVACSAIKIDAGGVVPINVSISVPSGFKCVIGATYTVNVYTLSGNVYSTMVRVVDCK